MTIIFVLVLISSIKGFFDGLRDGDRGKLRAVFIFWMILAGIVAWHFFAVSQRLPDPTAPTDQYDDGTP